MMQDAREFPDGTTLQADVCIVGAGAAGIALALEFIGTDLDVLLLESGGLAGEAETQALYSGSVADAHLHSPPDRYRQRRFGGTTTIWGGRCAPFDAIDFEARDYVAHSGWPFGRDELMPHYIRANRLCEAGEFAYTAGEAFNGRGAREMIHGLRAPSFSSDTLERFSCPTDFGTRYAHRVRGAANVRAVLHANVTGLECAPSGSAVERLTVRTLTGKVFTVQARYVVLAAGGLEVARLLLANRDVHPHGIGNQHDVVGRYYMCHLAGTLGTLTVPRPGAVWHGYDIADDGAYCRRRLALKPEAQRAGRIGNFIARLHHPRIADPAHRTGILSLLYLGRGLIPYEYAKRLDAEGTAGPLLWLQHLRNVVLDLAATLAFAWHLVRDRKLAERKFPSLIVVPRNRCYSLDIHAEQQPNPASRVTLGTARDALGQPRLHIDWRYTRGDVKTVQRALALLSREIGRSGIGHLRYNPQAVEMEMTRYGAYGGHHMGTARMGSDPRTSVTDRDGRVHGIDNLFVAGSALFPTSSQANPTLTIVALALRTAAHLKHLHARHAFAPPLASASRVVPIRHRQSA